MKLAKLLKRLSLTCFLLIWIPFAMVMIRGPLRSASGNLQDIAASASVFTSPWMYAVWALCAGAVIFSIASAIVSRTANRQILASGQDAVARILAIADTGTRINDDPVIDFSLQVQPMNGPAFVAQARQTVSIIYLPSFQPGRILHVKFIPGTDQVAIVGPQS